MIENFENGDWEEFELVNGKKHGKAVYYFSECKMYPAHLRKYAEPREERNYINGKLQGEAVFYFSDFDEQNYGFYLEKRNYIDGQLQGKAILEYTGRDNRKYEERNYIDGQLQGEAILYYKNDYYTNTEGYEKLTYINGEKQNKTTFYSKDGTYEERIYRGEKLGFLDKHTVYRKNKKIMEETLENSSTREKICYYDNGQIEKIELYDFKKNDIWYTQYPVKNAYYRKNGTISLLEEFLDYGTYKREITFNDKEKIVQIVHYVKVKEIATYYKIVKKEEYDENGILIQEDVFNHYEAEKIGLVSKAFNKLTGENIKKGLTALNDLINKYK